MAKKKLEPKENPESIASPEPFVPDVIGTLVEDVRLAHRDAKDIIAVLRAMRFGEPMKSKLNRLLNAIDELVKER